MSLDPRGSKNFSGFAVVFVVIIAVAFGVLAWAGVQERKPAPVDIIAQPK